MDAQGVAYVAGYTDSLQFPLVQPVQPAAGGARDAFAAALAATGATLSWSTYLGGAGEDRAEGVAVDAAGSVYVEGYTFSPDFRTSAGAYRSTYAAGEAFLVKLAGLMTISVSPASGSGSSGSFQFVASDPVGYTDVTTMEAVINASLVPANACYLRYERAANRLWLANEAGSQFTGPATPGVSATLSNSQCSFNAASATVVGTGTTLTLTLPVTFTAAFGGSKNVYEWASTGGGQNSGYQAVGTWTVPTPATPVVVSGLPANAATTPQTFTFTGRDPTGMRISTGCTFW